MKKALVWFLSLLILSGASFAAGRYYLQHRHNKISQESAEIDNGFRPANFTLHNRAFAIFICAYNNGAYVEKTLRSVFSQAYDNYRLIYIDDGSTDGSFELAREKISLSPYANRTVILHNPERLGVLANLMRTARVAQDQEVIVVLNPEDWLAHEWVLSRLNQYYADSDLWLSYCQYREFPTYHLGASRAPKQVEWSCLRQSPFGATHLQAFSAALLKRVNEADLMFQGAFLPQAVDLAVMLPMLEMAQHHFQFIPEILAISNRSGTSLDDREQQIRCERYVRALKPYSPLQSLYAPIEEEQP